MSKFRRNKNRFFYRVVSALRVKYVRWKWLLSLAIASVCFMLLVPLDADSSAALINVHKAEELHQTIEPQETMDTTGFKINFGALAMDWINGNRQSIENFINLALNYILFICGTLFLALCGHSLMIMGYRLWKSVSRFSVRNFIFSIYNFIISRCIRACHIIFKRISLMSKCEGQNIYNTGKRRKWMKEKRGSKIKQMCSLRKTCDILCQFSMSSFLATEVSELQILLEEMRTERREVKKRLEQTKRELDFLQSTNNTMNVELQVTLGLNEVLRAKVFGLEKEKGQLERRLNYLDKELGSLKTQCSRNTEVLNMERELHCHEHDVKIATPVVHDNLVDKDDFPMNRYVDHKTNFEKKTSSLCAVESSPDRQNITDKERSMSLICESHSSYSDEIYDEYVYSECAHPGGIPCQVSNCSICAENHYDLGKNAYYDHNIDYLNDVENSYLNDPAASYYAKYSDGGEYEIYYDYTYPITNLKPKKNTFNSRKDKLKHLKNCNVRNDKKSEVFEILKFNRSHNIFSSDDAVETQQYHKRERNRHNRHKQKNIKTLNDSKNMSKKFERKIDDTILPIYDYDLSSTSEEIVLRPLTGSLRPVTDSPEFKRFLRNMDKSINRYQLGLTSSSDSSRYTIPETRALSDHNNEINKSLVNRSKPRRKIQTSHIKQKPTNLYH